MPFIQTRTNAKIDDAKKEEIKRRLGEIIRIVGKSEDWLMLDFVPECDMYFKGSNESLIAYVDVKLYGGSSRESYNQMTGEITNLLSSELNINPSNIYVSYGEYDNWGWNGRNF